MLESVFITLIVMGFILLVLGIERENVIYNAISILMWIIVMAGQIYIESPHTASTYEEPAMLPVAIAFIIINVLVTVIVFTDLKTKMRYRLR